MSFEPKSKSEMKRLAVMRESGLSRIKCQADHGDFSKGCSTCGGFGTVFDQVKLDCGHKYWTRPGTYTMFEGKIFTSLDGLAIICLNIGSMCVTCYDNLGGR